ncbi:hypothetical protein GUITHDRAFT_143855 [Guillardia theta CCMP2712]|uniref:Class II aldolase/adducin N-terminal domain-containing protein n=1 Tax=Guillardia theta (strain CCMP2712) TaxID=905079 RepID=L1IT91_GUITC|nr:hypothetical protein GUITHDRAFT_143855 [Guillardia theta CCMP2712]EKX39060.1 hypothetical protein GUITHDRAFT_143855 [Guillardia theta CCMP2712]|eukprot:XP_005826040.1 hypothetical protein GUITHDRAFT_143855 [Guillardia theta CCMP2712]
MMVYSRWNDEEAAKCNGELFALRVYTSRLIGSDDDLVLHGGGNTSVKAPYKDIFGNEIPALYVKGSGWDLATIEKQGFAPVRMDILLKLPDLATLSDTDLVTIQKQAMLDPNAPGPSIETILHALIPYTFVDHSHSDTVCLVTNTPEGEKFIKEIYGDKALIVPYCMPGFVLAKKVKEMTVGVDWAKLDCIILLNHGIFTWGNDAKTSYENMIANVKKAEDFLKSKQAYFESLESGSEACEKLDPVAIAKIRKEVSTAAGVPMVVKANNGYAAKTFASLPDLSKVSQVGTLTPDHIIQTKRVPAIIHDYQTGAEQDVKSYVSEYEAYFNRNRKPEHKMLDPAPRWILLPGKGWCTAGIGVKQTKINDDIAKHTSRAIMWAGKFSCYCCLGEKDLFDVEYWELEQAKLRKGGGRKDFDGKVAVVTGGASGIGKAVVKAFLDAGACVVALDINPEVSTVFKSPAFLGIKCDLTDAEAVKDALSTCAHCFGGVDILVLNAGILPKSAPIEEIEPEQWDRSMQVNLTASQRLLTATIPYLKLGVDPCLIIVGTKNAPAPGRGMSCYSVAKAALTQLGRIAALELAPHGVRVNTVHPDAVFDTGLWSEEVLKTRAAAYNLTVDQYKRRNLLKAEITSHDVARVVRSLAGPDFYKVTGAQLPVNGGDERTV